MAWLQPKSFRILMAKSVGGFFNNLKLLLSIEGKEWKKTYAGILEQSMGTRNRVGIGLLYRPARVRICKRLRNPGIDSWAP